MVRHEIVSAIVSYEIRRIPYGQDYFICDNGDAYRYKDGLFYKLNQGTDPCGYPYVRVVIGRNKRRFIGTHRLVAEAFLLTWNSSLEVNHINGVKVDNSAHNLEMVTHAENMRHARRIGLHVPASGERNSHAKLTEIQVLEIRNSKNIDRKILADKYNVSLSTINNIIGLRTWRHI